MGKLLNIARSVSPPPVTGNKGEKGEKGVGVGGFSPFSPLFHSPMSAETTAPIQPTAEPTATLQGAERWNQSTANRLMSLADALPERFGVSGLHPDVQVAATVVVSANATRDMETLRFAVAEFDDVVRRIAHTRSKAGAT